MEDIKVIKVLIPTEGKIYHYIYSTPENAKQHSSKLLLIDKYNKLDKEVCEKNDWHYWFIFRRTWLRHRRNSNGLWACAYCNKQDLKLSPLNITKGSGNTFVTVDHIHPLSKGGMEFDSNNLVCSCKKCNTKKGNKIIN